VVEARQGDVGDGIHGCLRLARRGVVAPQAAAQVGVETYPRPPRARARKRRGEVAAALRADDRQRDSRYMDQLGAGEPRVERRRIVGETPGSGTVAPIEKPPL